MLTTWLLQQKTLLRMLLQKDSVSCAALDQVP